jgi:hypothetical protein
MADRSCGGCTACCKTHPVLEIDKPLMTWCSKCSIGSGCQDYTHKPSSCTDFKCAWLLGLTPESERPDKIRLVFDLAPSQAVAKGVDHVEDRVKERDLLPKRSELLIE